MYDDAFGYWFSGFTDGEGCFHARVSIPQHDPARMIEIRTVFQIALRADDLRVLEKIRQTLGVGGIFAVDKRVSGSRMACPQYSYTVTSKKDLSQVIIPHFEKYPLLSKKSRDFAIWKRLVLECKLQCINGKPTPAEIIEKATSLVQQLKEIRDYQEVEWTDYPRPGKGCKKPTPLCPKCGETDPAQFHKRPNDAWASWCKGCVNKYNNEKYHNKKRRHLHNTEPN